MRDFIAIFLFAHFSIYQVLAVDINVNSLKELNEVLAKSGNHIKLEPGSYDLKDLRGRKRGRGRSKAIVFSGSNNKVDLRGVSVNVTVGRVDSSYLLVTGKNNLILGGEFEDTYRNGVNEVTDFVAYNKDRSHYASGLGGDPVMAVSGSGNTIDGLKLTVRGSFPYGYGSMFGIGADHSFGLDKRCGILISGPNNTVNGAQLKMRAFGHGIYMQDKADKTLIKNCVIEGVLRKTAELYKETDPESLPKRANYQIPREDDKPIPKDAMYSLCEDGIRMYGIPGSVTVENCVVRKMRGGIRLYLGGPAVVKNCTAVLCENTGYNLPANGEVAGSIGDFSFAPLSDYRLNRSDTKVEWTILPSPHAIGDHNILDVKGNGHRIMLNRSDGPIDNDEKRSIVIYGNGSRIINNTEYSIVFAKGAKDNEVSSASSVSGDLKGNKVSKRRALR